MVGKTLLGYLRSIMDACPVPMAVNDDAYNIVLLNRKFTDVFGYLVEDIPHLSDWWPKAYPDPVYRQWVADTWKQHMEAAASSGTDFVPMDIDIRDRDGERHTVIATAASLGDMFSGMHLVIL